MSSNNELVSKFYSAFAKLDAETMNSCYSDDIVFSDPVFMILKGDEAKSMWTMLCKSAKDFALTFSDIEELDEEYITCKWVANYTFSKTGNRVENRVKAFMKIKDGKIVEHSDGFRLSTWIGQALGWKGKLFGWTGFMKRAVQKTARQSLLAYMQRNER